MSFYSHSKKDVNGQKIGSKLLSQHTAGVKKIAMETLPKTSLQLDMQTILASLTGFHDLGKYISYFQQYLLGEKVSPRLKSHARFGAFVAYNYWKNDPEADETAFLSYYLILRHHLNLAHPADSLADKFLSRHDWDDVEEVFLLQKTDFLKKLSLIQADYPAIQLSELLILPDRKQLKNWLAGWQQNITIAHYFQINYLFSLLIEADKLDASDTPVYTRKALPIDAVAAQIQSFSAPATLQNQLRAQVRQKVLEKLDHPKILQQRLFLLTAPTGIGKTLTALDFALQLRGKIAESEQRQAQIITGLPFINIIEQTLQEYQDVFAASEVHILAHYQYADIFGASPQGEPSDEREYGHKLMQLDTWQADIVITSFVQFLQTLISHRNKLLKKFNHFAGAIIILDEVQSIRLEQVPLVGAMLYYLAKFLDTRLILMTATQPLIFELADQILLKQEGECATEKVFSLLDDPAFYFSQFHRTQLIPRLETTLQDEQDFMALFESLWQEDKSCLIVVNTVNRSLKVHAAIQQWLEDKGLTNPLFYLSTNVIPAHRMSRIGDKTQDTGIKGALRNKSAPILVSTQVVEAGVDLDFDMGFRDIGPIDSIIQVAGRVNRENSADRKYSPLYIVDFQDCQKIYGPITLQNATNALSKSHVPEPEYYRLIAEYFKEDAGQRAFAYSQKMFEAIKQLRYDGDEAFTVSKFRVIEESTRNTSVFIEVDELATAAREAFIQSLTHTGEAKQKAKLYFDQQHKKNFHQHIISVPNYLLDQIPMLCDDFPDIPIKWVQIDHLPDFYDSGTGFIRNAPGLTEDHSTYIL